MITATYYTKEGLAEIFQTAQNASFMGIVSAYKPHRIINGKKQPISEEENYYRHKFLGLMLNEKGIACASFCALSSRASGDSSLDSSEESCGESQGGLGEDSIGEANVESGLEFHTESSADSDTNADSHTESKAESCAQDSKSHAIKANTPQAQSKEKKENYEWYFYLVWGDNNEACSGASMEVERLGRACESAYYLSSGGIMQGFTPKSAEGKPLKPYIGKKPLSAQRAINMMHRWFLDTSSDELLGLRFYQSIDNRSVRARACRAIGEGYNIMARWHIVQKFKKNNPPLNAEEYLRSDSKLMESIAHKTLPPFMLREIVEEKSFMRVDKSSFQRD